MRIISRLTAAAVIALSLNAPAAAFAAATPDDQPVSWSVTPADVNGVADHRPWVELTLAPGETAEAHMLVTNRGTQPATFRLSAADGYFTDTGRFNILPAGQPSKDAGTWITLTESTTIAAGASQSIPFTVTVPPNATPGDHAAGVAAGVLTGDGAVGVESRIGFRVMTRVTGELRPAIKTTVEATYHPSWNPFQPGTLELRPTIANAGNTIIAAHATATISGFGGIGTISTDVNDDAELAPAEYRSTSLSIDGIWPLFATTVAVDATAAPVIGDEDPSVASASSAVTVATIPWSQMALALLIAGLILLSFLNRRRRARRMQKHLDQAREEGRRLAGTQMRLLAISIAVVATIGIIGQPVMAHAASPGVSVEVEITPEPTSPVPVDPAQPNLGQLPSTGFATPSLVIAGGFAAIAIGGSLILFKIQASRRSRRRQSVREEWQSARLAQ